MSSPTYVPIERVEGLTVDDFRRRFDHPQLPVVITGAMREWKALSRWNHAWFKTFGDLKVQLSLERAHNARSKETTISDYVDSILNDTAGGHYMDQFPFERIPELNSYVESVYVPQEQLRTHHLWLGPANTEISFHKDNHDPYLLVSNLFAQISGRKRVLLVTPDQDSAMYPFDSDQGPYWHSQVDHNAPDFEKFPRFRHVRILEAILHPGEMLFIPGNYWHSVRALDRSISVSCWWFTHRLVDLFFAGSTALQEGKAFTPITIPDVDAFGGVARLLAALDVLPPEQHEAVLTLSTPEVRRVIQLARGTRDRVADVDP